MIDKAQLVDLAVEEMAQDDDMGICIECGEPCGGVEPDAEKYECFSCGEFAVYGCEQILLRWG